MANVKTLRTLRFTIYHVGGKVTIAKANSTGRFVKRAIAQAALDAHFASRAVVVSNTLACAAIACAIIACVFVAIAVWAAGDLQVLSALLAVVTTTGACAFKRAEGKTLARYWVLASNGNHYVRSNATTTGV